MHAILPGLPLLRASACSAPGYYQPAMAQGSCLPCPGGTVCPDLGTVNPTLCGPGVFCPLAAKVAVLCPIGSFSNRSGLANESDCSPCTPGSYCPRQGLTAPVGTCDAGFFCSGGSWLPNPVSRSFGDISPQGYYAPAGSGAALPCPAGRYNPSAGSTSIAACVLCDAGFYCNATGLAAPTGRCSAGFTCPPGAVTGVEAPVPAGAFAVAGSVNYTLCPPGSYQSAPAQGACALSPPGFAAPAFGTVIPVACTPGFYCPRNTTSPSSFPCPAGRFSNATDLQDVSSCSICPAGFFCDVPGLSAPAGPCAGGWYCSPGSDSPTPGL